MHYHLTLKSSNAKTGPIPVSTTDRASCPTTCPLRGNGCYAEHGKLALHWKHVSSGAPRAISLETLRSKIAALPLGQLWRHNQAGDLPGSNGRIDRRALLGLAVAGRGRRGFTYTHYPVSGRVTPGIPDSILRANRRAIRACNDSGGLTINLSAQTLHQADYLSALDIGPVVALAPADQRKTMRTQLVGLRWCAQQRSATTWHALAAGCAKCNDVPMGAPGR